MKIFKKLPYMNLDREWLVLMKEAKELGLSKEDVRQYLQRETTEGKISSN